MAFVTICSSANSSSQQLFTGHGNAWQPHLQVATGMSEQCYQSHMANIGLLENSRIVLRENLPAWECEPNVVEEVAAFRFLTGTIVWLDITASVTAGTTPRLISIHDRVFAPNSQIRLEEIMGCNHWVLVAISRISSLQEMKTRGLVQGSFDCTKFEQTANELRTGICYSLAQLDSEGLNGSKHGLSASPTTPARVITPVFARMAAIYLHLVTVGFQDLKAVEGTMSEAMAMLQGSMCSHFLPALVSPLLVMGCVARAEDQDYFRGVFSSPPLLERSLKHRARILPVLQEVWSRRRSTESFAWEDCLELASGMLVI